MAMSNSERVRRHYAAMTPDQRRALNARKKAAAKAARLGDPEKMKAYRTRRAKEARDRHARKREARELHRRVISYVPIIDAPRDTQASVAELMALVAVRRAEREAEERARAAEAVATFQRFAEARKRQKAKPRGSSRLGR